MLKKATGEWIVRTTAARTEPRRFTQLGIEGTLNTLEGNTKLTLDLGDGRVAMSIPNAAVNVRENRAEVFVSHTWRPRAEWSLDGHLALELSNLRFRGDVTKSVTLAYTKPSVSISRTFANRTQLYGRLARVIGQLDFADFVSTASLADDQLTGANPDLRPQSSWRGEAGADFRFHADAGIRIAAFHDWYDNVVDWIAYGEGAARIDAPGNAGRARASAPRFPRSRKYPALRGFR
jgi:outer membrane receptor protein involved in Fe transport